jgi:hypothetical protein
VTSIGASSCGVMSMDTAFPSTGNDTGTRTVAVASEFGENRHEGRYREASGMENQKPSLTSRSRLAAGLGRQQLRGKCLALGGSSTGGLELRGTPMIF